MATTARAYTAAIEESVESRTRRHRWPRRVSGRTRAERGRAALGRRVRCPPVRAGRPAPSARTPRAPPQPRHPWSKATTPRATVNAHSAVQVAPKESCTRRRLRLVAVARNARADSLSRLRALVHTSDGSRHPRTETPQRRCRTILSAPGPPRKTADGPALSRSFPGPPASSAGIRPSTVRRSLRSPP